LPPHEKIFFHGTLFTFDFPPLMSVSPSSGRRQVALRKGVIGDRKNHFDPEAVDMFMQTGAGLLRELGYESQRRAARR
jgi:hypothetical protein